MMLTISILQTPIYLSYNYFQSKHEAKLLSLEIETVIRIQISCLY